MKRITRNLGGTLLLFMLFDALPHAQPRPQQESKPSMPAVNLAECKPATFNFPRPLGSESLVVKGRRKTRCVIRYTREIEGGYSESECRVPVSLGTLRLSDRGDAYLDPRVNRFSVDVSKYCKVVKQGNIFFDRLPKVQGRPKRGTVKSILWVTGWRGAF